MLTLLDNSLFDDGSIECLNFWVCDKDETYQASLDYIRNTPVFEQVKSAIQNGKSYVSVNFTDGEGIKILEIQWG